MIFAWVRTVWGFVIFGRTKFIVQISDALCRDRKLILVHGPGGIGKSSILSGISAYSSKTYPTTLQIKYAAAGAGFTLSTFVKTLVEQLLEAVPFKRPSLADIRQAMNAASGEYSGKLVGAWILDGLSASPLKETAKALVEIVEESATSASARAEGQRIVKESQKEILPGLLFLLNTARNLGVKGVVLVDQLEDASDSVIGGIDVLVKNLPPDWSVCIACNSESPEGTRQIKFFTSLRRAGKLSFQKVNGLVPDDVQAWCRKSRACDGPGYEIIMSVCQECQGRPFWIQEWIFSKQDTPQKNVTMGVSEHFQERVLGLHDEATRNLIRSLSLLPHNVEFDFPLVQRLLQSDDLNESVSAVEELRQHLLVEALDQSAGTYRFSHEIAADSIRSGLPPSVRRNLAGRLLGAVRESELSSNPFEDRFCKLQIAKFAEEPTFATDSDIDVGKNLLESGAVQSALETFAWLASAAESIHNQGFYIKAIIGLARAYFQAGQYAIALAQLEQIRDLHDSEDLRGDILLLKGELLIRLNRYDLATNSLQGAVAHFEQQGNIEGVINARRKENVILRDLEKYEDAQIQAESVISDIQKLWPNPTDAPQGLYAACLRAGARSFAYSADKYETGRKYALQALEIAEAMNSVSGRATAYLAIGEVNRHSCKTAEAIGSYQDSLKFAQTVGDRDCGLWALLGLSDAALMARDMTLAQDSLLEAETIVRYAPEAHPLENAHWEFSDKVLKAYSGNLKAGELDKLPPLYLKLGLQWPQQYAMGVPNDDPSLKPKSF